MLPLHLSWLSALHTALAVHCGSDVQPHTPAVHFGPGLHPVMQSLHVPDVPQALSVAPPWHVPPSPVQQPPLHAVWLAPPHALPHFFCDVSHACPGLPPAAAAQSVADSQPHVSVPGSHFVPTGLPVHTAHVPEPPHAPGVLPATHALPEQQKPPSHAPLPAAPHAEVHAPDVHVGVPPPQPLHARPSPPHAPFAVPATQLPPLAQHPPLQACAGAQLVVHWDFDVSHAQSGRQSVAAKQPHVRFFWQTWPFADVVQLAQNWPVGPHALFAFPVTQSPAVWLVQQPMLHGLVETLHDVEQVWLVLSHACPAGQSACELHPHAPFGLHAWPAALAEQSTHAVPLPPHTAVDVPGWHVPVGVPAQHPVGHGCDALQVKLQMPPLQPCAPGPQSPTVLQPHWPPPATGSQTCPCVLPAQALQAPPLLPHEPSAVPATHLPPAEQHPPLHVCVALHEVVQTCVVVSHALPAGQSVTELQPQNVAPPAVTHCVPLALAAQLVQAGCPATAHAVAMFPDTQVPALQHPPLHVRPPVHDGEHA